MCFTDFCFTSKLGELNGFLFLNAFRFQEIQWLPFKNCVQIPLDKTQTTLKNCSGKKGKNGNVNEQKEEKERQKQSYFSKKKKFFIKKNQLNKRKSIG